MIIKNFISPGTNTLLLYVFVSFHCLAWETYGRTGSYYQRTGGWAVKGKDGRWKGAFCLPVSLALIPFQHNNKQNYTEEREDKIKYSATSRRRKGKVQLGGRR